MATININGFDFSSYATVEEADKYFTAKFGSTWNDIEEAEKKQLLVTATRKIDEKDFQGYKLYVYQELEFPRVIKVCECGGELSSIYPEKELIACVCELANGIFNNVLADKVVANADKIKSMSVGDTSITFRDGATIEADSYSAVATPLINKYLKKYLKGNVTIIL